MTKNSALQGVLMCKGTPTPPGATTLMYNYFAYHPIILLLIRQPQKITYYDQNLYKHG